MTIPADIQFASKQFDGVLGALKDRAFLSTHNQSFAMLRAVLHELRDHLSVEQAAAFGAMLPALVRGIFYEGWHPANDPPRIPAPNAFTKGVTRRLAPHHVPPETIVTDVLAVLSLHIDAAALNEALDRCPEGLRAIWPQSTG
jgi:uncharacterized protein (DUF2267 family)